MSSDDDLTTKIKQMIQRYQTRLEERDERIDELETALAKLGDLRRHPDDAQILKDIYAAIDNHPRRVAFGLLGQIEELREKNTELAKMLTDGIPRKPENYGKYHDERFDKERWL